MFADVIVDINNVEVDKVFEYSFSDCRITLGSRVIVPFGKKFIEGIVIGVKENSNYDKSKIKPINSLLEEKPVLTSETLALMQYVCKTCYVTRASALRLFLPSEMRKGKVKEQFNRFVKIKEGLDVDSAIHSLRKSAMRQKELLEFLKDGQKHLFTVLSERFGASAVNAVINKEYAEIIREKYFRLPYKDLASVNKQITLTEKQKQAVDSVKNTNKTVSLIFGVTGSGKTEVYLNLINEVIKKGKTAIMLVPEIALTPQMLKALRARFENHAAILHSGLSAGERFDEWWRLRNGEAQIAIGARSAIFAPLENVGLIIIDEEHEQSFKQKDPAPRYHARNAAIMLAHQSGAKVLLGSATPCLESYYNVQSGKYGFVALKTRFQNVQLPRIEVVDVKELQRKRLMKGPFSPQLLETIQSALEQRQQVILFQNRRGYAPTVECNVCGWVPRCQNCDVSLTYHKNTHQLACHYCGSVYPVPAQCPNCEETNIKSHGYGTERIEDLIKEYFPQARVARMDLDTAVPLRFSVRCCFVRSLTVTGIFWMHTWKVRRAINAMRSKRRSIIRDRMLRCVAARSCLRGTPIA